MNLNTNNIQDPSLFGELLRHLFFTKDGYGCYSNFKVESNFVRNPLPNEHYKYLGFDCSDDAEGYNIHFYQDRDNPKVCFSYYWDGDGTLVVSDGERVAVNNDCKKDYVWKFV
jgi:hypothetical protein